MSQVSGSSRTTAVQGDPEVEVVDICRDLLRIDTSNYGDGSGPAEREAAELVAGLLSDVGLEPQLYESGPRRANVFARVPGADPESQVLASLLGSPEYFGRVQSNTVFLPAVPVDIF